MIKRRISRLSNKDSLYSPENAGLLGERAAREERQHTTTVPQGALGKESSRRRRNKERLKRSLPEGGDVWSGAFV